MEFGKVLQGLIARLGEPLAGLTAFCSIIFVILFKNGASPQIMDTYLGFCGISFLVVCAYPFLSQSWKKGGKSDGEKVQLIQYRDRVSELETEVKRLEEDLRMATKVRNWADLHEEMIDIRSIDTDLDTPDAYKDRYNRYDELAFHADVDEDGNYAGKYIRKGCRAIEGKTDFLYFRVGASFHIEDYHQIKLKVKDLLTGKPLAISIADDSDTICKTFKIHLDKPVAKNEQFNIEISFEWPECITRTRDTDTLDLSMFALGVSKLAYSINLPFEPLRVRFYQIEKHDVSISDHYVSPDNQSLSVEIKNPQADGYVIAFSKPEPLTTAA